MNVIAAGAAITGNAPHAAAEATKTAAPEATEAATAAPPPHSGHQMRASCRVCGSAQQAGPTGADQSLCARRLLRHPGGSRRAATPRTP